MKKILVVDDEALLVKGIRFNLQNDGYEVITGSDGVQAVELARSQEPDLIVLDVMMPRLDGLGACSKIREFSDVPIILLTAKTEDMDKLLGFDQGADDYMTKPFSVKELVARIKANTRRKGGESRVGGNRMSFGPYVVDTGLQEVRRVDTAVELTQREYDLVCYFLNSAGRVVSREELMEKVWGYEYYGDLRTVDVAMRRLREKLEEDPANPKYFITKRGAGYYLQK